MKVLFYSLHAGIWPHALPENRLACELAADGHEIVYVSCGRSFPEHCTTYAGHNLATDAPRSEKDAICRKCIRNAATLAAGNGGKHLVLSDYITAEDRARVENLMTGVTRENYLDFQVDGVDVGRAITYELFLHYKKMSTRLSDDEWNYYRIYLRNALLSLAGYAHIHKSEKPDTVFFYSPQYNVNGVAAQYASLQGSKVYFVEGSSSNAERYEALRVWDWKEHGLVNPGLSHWHSANKLLTTEDIKRVTGHFHELLNAKSFAVYSEPAAQTVSFRQHFGIPDNARIVLATLSSFDEAYAANVIGKFPDRKVKSLVFRDQFEWIEKTIAHVAKMPDIFLIVRIHPRDYPNKRDPRQSEQAALWEKLFESRPSNVAINWPQDKISLYSVFQQVDAVVTGWSATGTEALVFGVPVVTYDRFLPSYPADIHFTGDSEQEYYANIAKALESGRGFAHAAPAYRWLATSFSLGTLRIPPPRSIGSRWPNTLPFRVLRKALRLLFEGAMQRRDATRGISSAQDAARLRTLVRRGEASLFDVVERQAAPVCTDEQMNAVIRREIETFTQART